MRIGGGIAQGIQIYFEDMDAEEATFKRLMYGDDTYIFQEEYSDRVLSCDFFQKYYNESEYPVLARGFMDSVTGIYMSWRRQKGRKPTLTELAERTAKLVMNGLSGLNP